jgi:hypothetical protein
MLGSGVHHGLVRGIRAAAPARVLALLVAASALTAQVSTLAHDAEVQHIRCAEHGELTHVVPHGLALVATPAAPWRAAPGAEPAGGTVSGAPAGTPEAHEHCTVVFAVQGGTHAPPVRIAARFAPPAAVARAVVAPAPRPGRAVVLASAPKTSPPVSGAAVG